MFVVRLHYIVPLETVDKHLPAHVEWLHKHETAGVFLVYGRLVPRTGGVIIAKTRDRAELDAILAGDPFGLNGDCTYEVMEFSENKSFADKARKIGMREQFARRRVTPQGERARRAQPPPQRSHAHMLLEAVPNPAIMQLFLLPRTSFVYP